MKSFLGKLGEKMLNCWCRKQMENNMFVLLNNFQTLISLSHRIFHGIFNTHAKTTRFSENNQTYQQKRGICWKWLPTNCAILHLWLCPQWSLSYPIFVNVKKTIWRTDWCCYHSFVWSPDNRSSELRSEKKKIVKQWQFGVSAKACDHYGKKSHRQRHNKNITTFKLARTLVKGNFFCYSEMF